MWAPDWTRLRFRDIAVADGYTVARWRNTPSAREAFFSQEAVTPDTHARFMANRKPHDLVWIIEEKVLGVAVGMLSLTVDVTTRTAEYGRAFLDERYRGRGYWIETEWMLLHFAFDVLALGGVWLEIYGDNAAMNAIHHRYGWVERNGAEREMNGRPVVTLTYEPGQWVKHYEPMRQEVTRYIIREAQG